MSVLNALGGFCTGHLVLPILELESLLHQRESTVSCNHALDAYSNYEKRAESRYACTLTQSMCEMY